MCIAGVGGASHRARVDRIMGDGTCEELDGAYADGETGTLIRSSGGSAAGTDVVVLRSPSVLSGCADV